MLLNILFLLIIQMVIISATQDMNLLEYVDKSFQCVSVKIKQILPQSTMCHFKETEKCDSNTIKIIAIEVTLAFRSSS